VGGRDTSQYLGYGEDIIPSGSIVPEFKGKRASLDELRLMGNTGLAFALVEGTAAPCTAPLSSPKCRKPKPTSRWTARPAKIEFTLTLRRVDQDDDGRPATRWATLKCPKP
jgi:phage protein U